MSSSQGKLSREVTDVEEPLRHKVNLGEAKGHIYWKIGREDRSIVVFIPSSNTRVEAERISLMEDS